MIPFFQRLSSRTVLVGLPLLLLALAPLWLGAMRSFLAPPPMPTAGQAESPPTGQQFLMEGLTFYQFEGNREEVRLTARQASSEDMDREIVLNGVAAQLRGEKGRMVDIESESALYEPPKQQVILQRSVHLQTGDFTGSTDLLNFYPEVKLVDTTKRISLSRPGLKITGTGLTYDLGTGELVVGGHGRVSCSID